MAFCDPRTDLWWLAAFAVVVAFSSATQDIALDAFRIEATDETLQGATAATYQLGYRIAVLAAGAGALYIAEFGSWPAAYITMAALALVGIVTTLVIAEPEKRVAAGTAEREGKIAAVRRPLCRPAAGAARGAGVDLRRHRLPVRRLLRPLRLARAGAAGLHRPVSPERHRHGRDGQSVLHRHGIQPAADRQRHQDLRLRHVDPGRPAGRRAGVPHGRRAAAGAVGVPDRRQQPHLLVARHHRPARSAGAGDGDQRRQPGERHGAARSSSPSCRASPTPPTRRRNMRCSPRS